MFPPPSCEWVWADAFLTSLLQGTYGRRGRTNAAGSLTRTTSSAVRSPFSLALPHPSSRQFSGTLWSWLDTVDSSHPGLAGVKSRAATVLHDNIRLMSLEDKPLPMNKALDSIIDDAAVFTAISGTSTPAIPSLVLTSDIPAYAHQVTSAPYAFADEFTGPGPHALLSVPGLSVSTAPRVRNTQPNSLGPRGLVAMLEQSEEEPWKHLVLLARYLIPVKPVFVRGYSTHLVRYILDGAMTDMFKRSINDHDMDRILSGALKGEWEEIDNMIHRRPFYVQLQHQDRPPRCHSRQTRGLELFGPGILQLAPGHAQAVEDINVAVEAVICARVKDHGPPPDHDNFQWIDQSAKTSEMMSKARSDGNKLLVLGKGLAYSTERGRQADSILAYVAQVEQTGMAAIVPHCRPMFDRHSPQQARQWILYKPEGYNFTLAAQASNIHAYEAAVEHGHLNPTLDLAASPGALHWVPAVDILAAIPNTFFPAAFANKLQQLDTLATAGHILVLTNAKCPTWLKAFAAASRLLELGASTIAPQPNARDNTSLFKGPAIKSSTSWVQHACPGNQTVAKPAVKPEGKPAHTFHDLIPEVQQLVVHAYCIAKQSGTAQLGFTAHQLADCLQWDIT
ncbi:uncharacterized protein EHS24_003660 [Apiotrichum porosum]|uniref:Uncharacterized protein n=1 Tax=Apiotrichum porosum TaxID=105984 RepID=A0A427XDP5_9TREE|nr:uncharacterized protein EHS24_003660 [Apiotrichum porosum]RSH77040.1 hypothetical protein EHS24_003660 [Apiotrichum porosum]